MSDTHQVEKNYLILSKANNASFLKYELFGFFKI